jgi:mRNA interferase MazF
MDMVRNYNQYEVHWIALDPTQGSEMSKTRPCVIVSPNELNHHLRTLIIAPITSAIKEYPWRVLCSVTNKTGQIAVDQLKVVDNSRIGAKISKLSIKEVTALKEVIQQMLVD